MKQDRRKGCVGKRRYASQVQADRYVDAFHTLGLDVGLNSYRCTFCDWWHIGHKRKRDKRRRQEIKERLNLC